MTDEYMRGWNDAIAEAEQICHEAKLHSLGNRAIEVTEAHQENERAIHCRRMDVNGKQ